MKVGDLVRENWGLKRVGLVISPIRRSTPRDNHSMRRFITRDVHYVMDVIVSGTGEKIVCDIDQLEVLNESR